jgi:hypothetical protein
MPSEALLAALDEMGSCFPRVPPPFEGSPAKIQTDGDSEYDYVHEFFDHRPWWTIDYDTLWSGYRGPPSACWHFMKIEAFAYYLPAFLLMCRDPEKADVLPLALCSSLAEPMQREDVDVLMALLTTQQRAVVRKVLRLLILELAFSVSMQAEMLAGLEAIWGGGD